MSEQKNDGGPAFPQKQTETQLSALQSQRGAPIDIYYPGMTLRDYFAAHIVAASLPLRPDLPCEQIAKLAFELSDAMIAERDK